MHEINISDRIYTQLHSVEHHLQCDPENTWLCPLDYMSCLSIIGDNSQAFLQGQLSCDISKVGPTSFKHAALCNVQGRIIALMEVLRCHDYQLVLPKDMIPLVQKDLKTVAMFSKVQIHQSENYVVFGIIGKLSDPLIPDALRGSIEHSLKLDEDLVCYSIANDLHVLIVKKTLSATLMQAFKDKNQVCGSLQWHYQYLKTGYFNLYPQTSGHFLPHKLSLHQLDYLSFDKGCYKGQEIIARMHYRSKLKHQLKHYTLKLAAKPYPGQALLNPSDQLVIGEIIDFCPMGEDNYYIAASVLIDFTAMPRLQEASV